MMTGCTAEQSTVAPGQVEISAPAQAATVVAADTTSARSVQMSQQLFEHSDTVVVAPSENVAAVQKAARTAILAGIPLLLSDQASTSGSPAPTPTADPATVSELTRLGASQVIAVGLPAANAGGATWFRADSVEDIASLTGIPQVALVGDVNITSLNALTHVTDIAAGRDVTLPHPAAALTGVSVILDSPAADLAAAATARAAGASLTLQPTSGDLLASPEVIAALQEQPDASVILLGSNYADQPDPAWSITAARTGYELPGGGQRLLDEHRFVAIYGAPDTPVLGILGEQDVAGTIARASDLAAQYAPLSDRPVVPVLEIITTVAAGSAGDDGNYSNELDPDTIAPYIDAAAQAGMMVLLDLQPGRSDFLSQATAYADLLSRPNVGLALDPEWRLGPGEVPLEQIGSVDAAEVNAVSDWLARLVHDRGLPPKMLVLHEFRISMITDRAAVDTSHPEIETVVHVDGQGSQPDKTATWDALLAEPPTGVGVGWKNFIDEDSPMLTPEQTMQVTPTPDLISYQ